MPFVKGQSGNPAGKPKGAGVIVRLKAKDVQATVNARAADMMEALLGKAEDVISDQLDEGNPQVAMWLMDRMLKNGTSMLPQSVELTLSTIEDVIYGAQLVTEMVMQRKLSIDDGVKMLGMLSQYATFRAFERIDELKTLVEEMKEASEAKTIEGQATRLPSWGRLSPATPTANRDPAE